MSNFNIVSLEQVFFPKDLKSIVPIFLLNTVQNVSAFGVNLCILSECGKIGTGQTQNMDTFCTVYFNVFSVFFPRILELLLQNT